MKQILLAGLACGALAGCETPQYPATANYTPPPPVAPQYPITKASLQTTEAPTPAPEATQTGQSAPPAIATPTPAAVDSAPLPPVVNAPAPAAPSSTYSPPPAATPPPTPAYTPPSSTRAFTPAPSYTPPERRTETRVIAGGKVVAARGMYRNYEVQGGDHLDAIARDLNTTRDELIEANHLKSPFRIHPGEHLRVPVAKAYVVESGDTLAAISHRFGVGLTELAGLNDLPERGRLSPGIYVALPANFDDHGPSRETVTEEVAAAPRPHATYRTEPPTPSYTPYRTEAPKPSYTPGAPYTPSPEALAAAAARREQMQRPASQTSTYEASRSYDTTKPEAPLNTGAIAAQGQGRFIWPVKGDILSPFGAAGMGRRNDGVDIGAPSGSEVRAAAVGDVVYAGDQVPGFGNLVLIKHAGGWVSAYAHLGSVSVHMRDTVYQGQQIGTVGQTGGVTQPQLHFELRYAASSAEKARPLDPLTVLPR